MINNLEELILLYSHGNWEYDPGLSKNPSITCSVIDESSYQPWDYHKLIKNPAISIQYILKHPSKQWDHEEFLSNPSLNITKIDEKIQTDQIFAKELYLFMSGCKDWKDSNIEDISFFSSIKEFIFPEPHSIADSNWLNYVIYNKCIREQIIQNPVRFILNTYVSIQKEITFLLLNNYIDGSLLYYLMMVINKFISFLNDSRVDKENKFYDFMHFDNIHADERIVSFFNPDDYPFIRFDPNKNCISLQYLVQEKKTHIIWYENITNPSIIQSIYTMYYQLSQYYGGTIPDELDNFDQVATLLKWNMSPKVAWRVIYWSSPHKMNYYEDNVFFTQQQFMEFEDIDTPLIEFSKNPNFDWELLADWTWKEYNFEFLSSNSFQQHSQYRQSQLLHELETLGICLEWNSLNDLMYDDFNGEQFLAKFEMLFDQTFSNKMTDKIGTESKKIKLQEF